MAAPKGAHALSLKILAECSVSKARTCQMTLPHAVVDTPVFMPVGTQGTLKGMAPEQLEDLDCRIILGNTYHLGHRPVSKARDPDYPHTHPDVYARGICNLAMYEQFPLSDVKSPAGAGGLVSSLHTCGLASRFIEHPADFVTIGPELLEKAGGLHKFMKWNRALLTDSGGFQMVSLLDLAEITEEGVRFKSPHDDSMMMLTPEHSMAIQNAIGADIMMQLDDVVHSLTTGERVEEAMLRSIRWLDRCIEGHKRPESQNLFAIVQGGLNADLRERCAKEMIKRDVPGFAIGGLSGGEEKEQFWRMVTLSTDILPRQKPRYLMGVGFAVDLVVCCALGCDMYDCVYPTRTARFGSALVPSGMLQLKNKKYEKDFRPIDDKCQCSTCKLYTRAYLHTIVTQETVACALITIHNVAYQLDLMKSLRESIMEDRFPQFVQDFFTTMFPDKAYPEWAVNALNSVNIQLR